MSGIGDIIGDVGGAVSDLFGASGSEAAGQAYGTAAQIANSNAALTLRSGQIQEQQQDIALTKAIGGEKATTSGAGFNNSGGTATDLLRSSAQQGALSKQLIANQTEITAQGYTQQAAAYTGQQQAAQQEANAQKASGASKGLSGALGIVGDVASVVGWIICTELVRQRRMPLRWYNYGAQVFRFYPDAVKEGYYVWAVPSVRHLRKHPQSLYSRFLCKIFNWRAENIAAHAGVPKARKLVRGAIVTAVLWPLCYGLGWARLKLNRNTDWQGLYNAEH